MEELKLKTAKLTGPFSQLAGWTQVHTFTPQEADKIEKRGEIVAVVSSREGGVGLAAVEAGREVLTRLHEEYYGKLEATAFNALKATLDRVYDEFAKSGVNLDIIAASFVNGVVYSAIIGRGKICLYRDGMVATILAGQGSSSVAASGYPHDGDSLILGTDAFFREVAEGVLKAALASGSPEGAIEVLAPIVRTHPQPQVGICALSFTKKGFDLPNQAIDVFGDYVPKKVIRMPSFRGLKKIPGLFSSFVSKALPKKSVYVRGADELPEVGTGKKVASFVGGALIVLLLVSVLFGSRQKSIRESKARYESRLNQAEHEIEESMSLVDINPLRARELFLSSINLAEILTKEGVKDERLTSLNETLAESRGKILGEYRVELQEFLDLTLIRENFKGDVLSQSEGTISILDKGSKRVLAVAISTKKTEVIAGPEQVGEGSTLASYTGRHFILLPDGIYEIGAKKEKVVADSWDANTLVKAYAGNLYVLDKNGSTVWRYPALGLGFGSKQKWLGEGISPDFSQVTSWAIDGSLWLISSGGRISKFSLGKQDAFSPVGLTSPVASPKVIYTNEVLTGIYILGQDRVVVLNKETGEFRAEYVSDKISEASSLAVSEEDKKIILMAGSKLYSMPLSHLK